MGVTISWSHSSLALPGATIPDAPKIFPRHVYGWFVRVERRMYALTQEGMTALSRWPQAYHISSSESSCDRSRMIAWAASNSDLSTMGSKALSARTRISGLLRTRFFFSLKERRFQTLFPMYF